MTDRPADAADATPSTSSVVTDDASGWQRWSVLLPALTFVVGLVLGAVVVGVSATADDGSEGPLAAASPSADATPTPAPGESSGALLVTVPAPCVEAAEKAEVAYGVIDEAVQAVRELDARLLADVVDQAQLERAEIEVLVEACREEAGTQLVEPAVTAPPSPEPTTTS